MVFSGITFLCLFLPIFLVVYNFSKSVAIKNLVLLFFSLLFYAWGEPIWILAMLFSGITDYFHGRIINKYRGKWQAKGALVSSLVLNLGLLFLFKYSGFAVETINSVFQTGFPIPKFNLPLGISFYTFQTLSYTIDLYRGDTKYQKSIVSFLCYVTMFPQLVAGPIVRYQDIAPRLDDRKVTLSGFSEGIMRFAAGMMKKVLLANSAGAAAALLIGGDLSKGSVAGMWLGIAMFSFQIYFDFSGYSDMAIGLGKMIGFDFKENFNYPYIARSITDFWRRWHISLSTFFRDYVYIPLGGNRKRAILNLSIVWLLTGIWHGASWNFILWGVYYGIFLILEKYVLKNILEKLPAVLKHFYSLGIIVFGWAIFYFTDMSRLYAFIKAALGSGVPLVNFVAETTFLSNLWLIIILIIASTPLPKKVLRALENKWPTLSFGEPVMMVVSLFISFILLLGQTYNPFLYFRF